MKSLSKTGLILFCAVLIACGGEESGEAQVSDRILETTAISINPTTDDNFTFAQDAGDRIDKVFGTMQFTVTDVTNGVFINDLDTTSFEFSERDFGSEDEFVVAVEAKRNSEIQVNEIDVLYLIDRSLSVVDSGASSDLIEQANSLAARIDSINGISPIDSSITRYITFADDVSEIQESVHTPSESDTTSTTRSPFSDLAFEEEGSGTALYQAMNVALNAISEDSKNPVLFVFTDGRENASPQEFDKELVIETATNRGIPVFIAGLGDVDVDALEEIATASGGSVSIANSAANLSQAFDEVLKVIPVKYTVIYRPTQRTGHKEFSFAVIDSNIVDLITGDFNVDELINGVSE